MKQKFPSIFKKIPKENLSCPCVYYDCSRHGNCSECQNYHHKRKEKTGCGK